MMEGVEGQSNLNFITDEDDHSINVEGNGSKGNYSQENFLLLWVSYVFSVYL